MFFGERVFDVEVEDSEMVISLIEADTFGIV